MKIRRNLIEIICANCKKPFYARPDFIEKGEGKYCNNRCANEMRLPIRLGLSKLELRNRIEGLALEGHNFKSMAVILGIKPTTVSSYCKKFEIHLNVLSYDWDEIRLFYENGGTFRECHKAFGISLSGLSKAIKSGRLQKQHHYPNKKISYTEYAEKHNGYRSARGKIRQKVIEECLLPYECALCGITEWKGVALTLRLDHINGDGRNHNLNNLRFLCPNCDSLLPTYGHRNRGRYKDGGHNLMAG